MGSMRIRWIAAVILSSIPVMGIAQGRTPLAQSPELKVLHAPASVRIAGKSHLVYELHVTNLRSVDIELLRVGDLSETKLVGAGKRAVLYFWQPVETVPAEISHRIEFDVIRATGRERAVAQSASWKVETSPPVVLGPPLRGDRWVALYDPAAEFGHRRVLYTLDGRARIPGRFAIDWMKLGPDNKFAKGDESRIANWHGYGADVLAVADATVAEAHDDIEELPTIADATGPTPLERASGNYVVLDLGNGRFAFYEHLRPRSIRVKAGERVKQGQVIAQLGNTGSSSSGPHLHFHVADAPATLAAEGLPFVLSGFEMQGVFTSMDAVGSGAAPAAIPQGLASARANERPVANSVVKF
jgi:murein DD-endopeptidase